MAKIEKLTSHRNPKVPVPLTLRPCNWEAFVMIVKESELMALAFKAVEVDDTFFNFRASFAGGIKKF